MRSGRAGDGLVAVRAMTASLEHRGPDDEGLWTDAEQGIAFGHRRLSILDLTPEGHQPMTSPSGRYVAVFNGEIYNFGELRDELAAGGQSFRGHSDTEVIVAGFDTWGLVEGTRRLAGMFAIAVWDRCEHRLTLIRDRLGEKPLYYASFSGTILFGSELRALRAHPCWRGNVNRDALSLFFRHNCVPAPYSIFEGVRKVMPGTLISFSDAHPEGDEQQYWSAVTMVEYGTAHPLCGSDAEIIDSVEHTMRRVIGEQMVADVPLGAFLSGGIDSSTIVALMQAQSSQRVRTFTIGFQEEGYNEAVHAAAVARHLGTAHTELYVTPEETLAIVPELPRLYDEPFADSSQIPTFLVARLARQSVTVCLSGDGGDELFGGYNRYNWVSRLWNALRPFPRGLRESVAQLVQSVPPARWDWLGELLTRFLPGRCRHTRVGDKAHKLAPLLGARSPRAMYRQLTSHWDAPTDLVIGSSEPATALTAGGADGAWNGEMSVVERMMYLDLVSYLPDDILVKVDRATMAVSLESRAPFLDHRLAELAWRVPLSNKIRARQGKWILRQILYRYVPRSLVDRPKMGFGIPIEHWLRGPLHDWAADLLEPGRIRRQGYLRPEPIQQAWREHQSGTRNWQYRLWDALMFQAWLEAQ